MRAVAIVSPALLIGASAFAALARTPAPRPAPAPAPHDARVVLSARVVPGLQADTTPPGATTAAAATSQVQAGQFPHKLHEGLFPECTSCHRGVRTGVASEMFPPPSACANCHDGKTMPPVGYQGRSPSVTNLKFVHTVHQASVDSAGETTACLTCHRTPGEQGSMAVSPPQPQYCIGCHAHKAPQHMAAEAHCTTCHIPLVKTRFTTAQVAALPKPPDHAAPDWVLKHAPSSPAVAVARCAVCHARQSCERCHFNAARVPAIQALQPDDRVASLVRGRKPSYPKPPSHDTPAWPQWKHGVAAGGGGVGGEVATGPEAMPAPASPKPASPKPAPAAPANPAHAGTTSVPSVSSSPASVTCSACHARASCRSCHRQVAPAAVMALPAPGPDSLFGVRVPLRAVHAPGWIKDHPAQAASGGQCAACHTRSYCVDCHQGQKSHYHPPDFVEQHGPEAYNNDTQCSTCHTTQTFCRSCHLQTGRGARTRTGAAFHGSQSFWLLNHGQAARQNLEACAACHTQASCAQCHSATGGWGIDPHPANFDAKRAQQQNPQSCLKCHITLPK